MNKPTPIDGFSLYLGYGTPIVTKRWLRKPKVEVPYIYSAMCEQCRWADTGRISKEAYEVKDFLDSLFQVIVRRHVCKGENK